MPPPIDPLAAKIVRDCARHWAYQATFRENWQLIAEFEAPHKAHITVQRTPGSKHTQRLYDGTAIDARVKCAASIHGWIASPSQEFFSYVIRQTAINDLKPVRDYLEEASRRVYAAKSQSNWTPVLASALDDIVTFSPGVIFSDKRPRTRDGSFGGFVYTYIPLGEYAMDENAEGQIDRLYRKFTVSRHVAVERWGPQATNTLDAEELKAAEDRPEEPLTIIHAVYPRVNRRRHSDDALDMPYASCYVLERGEKLLDEGGYTRFPYSVGRWSKDGIYGQGAPGWLVYPDVRSLNKLIELNLAALGLEVLPPWLTTEHGVTLNLSPGAMNDVESLESFKSLEMQRHADRVMVEIDRLDRKIRQGFHNDLFEPKEKPAMTATETVIRNEWQLRMLGPVGGMIQHDLLGHALELDFAMMAEDEALPPMPQELIALAQGGNPADLDVKYEGVLARAQLSADLTAIQRTYEFWQQQINTGDPAAIAAGDNLVHDEALIRVAEIAGSPGTILAGKQVVARIRAARQAQQQAQQQATMLMEGAKAAGSAAPMLRELHAASTSQTSTAA